MKEKLSTSVLVLLLSCLSFASHAFDQRSCMQGIDEAMNSMSVLDAATNNMSATMLALLRSGIATDDETVTHLTNNTQLASASLNSALVVSTLRRQGSFKQPALIDEIVKIEFQGAFEKFRLAKESFTKFTGSLKNSSLREQAFTASQELEKITNKIRACQK